MLVFKSLQVICATRNEAKDWSMNGKSGVSHSAFVCVVGMDGKASNIKIKAASAEDLNAKIGQLTIGKPYEFPIVEIVPVFKTGERKAASYEYVADVKIPLAVVKEPEGKK